MKPISTFGPRTRPHADWIDKNIGDGDGMLSETELAEYKRRFPDATEYEALARELGISASNTTATTSTNSSVDVGQGKGVLGFLLKRGGAIDAPRGPLTTRLADGDYNLSAYRSDAETRGQLPPAPPELTKWLAQKHPNIPVEDLLAIRAYSAKEYTRVNAALDGAPGSDLASVAAIVKCAASGLAALPSYVGVAYRGAIMSRASIEKYVEGSVVAERRFTSASASSHFAETWRAGACNVVFVINARATGHAVAHLSAKPEEAEILFTPGTQFRVLKNEYDADKKKTFIYLDEHV